MDGMVSASTEHRYASELSEYTNERHNRQEACIGTYTDIVMRGVGS